MTANPVPPTVPTRVRLEGTVTAVDVAGGFTLKLADGKELAGIATGSQLRRLGKFLGRDVLVLGNESLDGTLTADGVLPAVGPFILGAGDWPLSPSEAAESSARFCSIIGKWPGDETDEQIEAMLKDDR